MESRYEGTKNFTPCPQKIGFWAQKRPNLAQNWHFGPNIGIFGPLDLRPDQKTMRTSCLDGFLLCWYQDFLRPLDIWPKIGPKYAFLVILGQILPFFAHFVQCPTKNKVLGWVFRYVGNKTFDFSSKKKGIFCPKTTKFGPKLAFLFNLGQAMQDYSVPC